MRYTTLGTGTIALSPTRACAGHLVEAGAVRLLIDCGSGVTRRMAELGVNWHDITHVALTHFHIDHHGDLPTLIFAWKYGQLPTRSEPLTIIGPVGTADLLDRLAAAYGAWVRAPGFEITVVELAPDGSVALPDGLTLAARKVPHTPESVAYSIVRGSRRIVFSGDTGFDESLADWARGADLFVLECSLPEQMAIVEHLTPEQCAVMAERAAPKRLALVHFYPPVEQVDVAAIVAGRWAGPVTLAHDGWHIDFEED